MSKMTNDEYLAVQMQLAAFDVVLRAIPLDAFLERAHHAAAVGPILDPTLYRDHGEKLDHVIRVAEALRDAQQALRRCAEVTA